MSSSMKVGLLGLLIVAALGIGIWRTHAALKEAHTGSEYRGPSRANSGDWNKHLEVSELQAGAEGARSVWWTMQEVDPAKFHTQKLAHFRWRDAVATLDGWADRDHLVFPVYNKCLELGGALLIPRAIEDEAPGLTPGEGILNLDLYQVSTGPIELREVKQRHLPLCTVIKLDPSGEGARQGLKLGDVIATVGDFNLLDAPAEKPCKVLGQRMVQPEGEKMPVTLFREGKKLELELVSPKSTGDGHPFKFRLCEAVVLDADLAH